MIEILISLYDLFIRGNELVWCGFFSFIAGCLFAYGGMQFEVSRREQKHNERIRNYQIMLYEARFK